MVVALHSGEWAVAYPTQVDPERVSGMYMTVAPGVTVRLRLYREYPDQVYVVAVFRTADR